MTDRRTMLEELQDLTDALRPPVVILHPDGPQANIIKAIATEHGLEVVESRHVPEPGVVYIARRVRFSREVITGPPEELPPRTHPCILGEGHDGPHLSPPIIKAPRAGDLMAGGA